MIFYRYLLLIGTLLCTGFIAQADDEFHTFTNADGQTIKAKPLRMQGERVEIQREDGQTFIVDPTIFTVADQAYLKTWQKQSAIDKGAIEVKATSATTRKVKIKSEGLDEKHYKGYYKVSVVNSSEMSFKDLKAEYRFFLFQNQIAADKRSDGELKRFKGDVKISSLSAYGKYEFETEQAEMTETDLKAGWHWEGGGKGQSQDELKGIWVRIYKDKEVIAEFANPSNLSEKEDW